MRIGFAFRCFSVAIPEFRCSTHLSTVRRPQYRPQKTRMSLKQELYISVKREDKQASHEEANALMQIISEAKEDLKVICQSEEISTFNTESYFANLSTSRVGYVLLYSPELQSTQDFMKSLEKSLIDGTVCMAMRQVAGKAIDFATTPFLNYIVCLAIVRAIQNLSQRKLQGHDVKAKIKWPNDIYYADQKIGGVLLNSSLRGNQLSLITGVGLNVKNEQPTLCLQQIFQAEGDKLGLMVDIGLEECLAEILNQLEALLNVFVDKGFSPLQEEYLSVWLHSDQRLNVESRSVVVKGISKNGYLLAEEEDGSSLELYPDGNSLDFLQGLISRKT